jgi:integrase
MKVHLRQRKQTDKKISKSNDTNKANISLYLEIYKGTAITKEGKSKILRDYEYLNLYLIDKPTSIADKQINKDTLALAEKIKNKRQSEIDNGTYGFNSNQKKQTNFIDYIQSLSNKRYESKGNFGNWESLVKHLKKFAGLNLTFNDVNVKFCEDFRDYLNSAKTKSNQKLSSGSVSSYYSKFRVTLKQAVKDKIILSNPSDDISTPKVIEKQREYLTLDEIKALVKIECRYEVLKRAFIFSCLTGLRWSDINNLIWNDVEITSDGCRITFHQQKTKGLQYLDISEQAKNYLGTQGNPFDRVFIGLKYSSYANVELTKWMLKAGITKDITFHCARHTFAVLQLSLGTEIYTLSKLLGHSEIKTTQVYAKIIDAKKKEAVNKIPDISI